MTGFLFDTSLPEGVTGGVGGGECWIDIFVKYV